jgi:hypothetical protein
MEGEREKGESERGGGLSWGRNGLPGLIGGSKVHCPCPRRLNIAFNILDFASCYCYFRCLARISFYVTYDDSRFQFNIHTNDART